MEGGTEGGVKGSAEGGMSGSAQPFPPCIVVQGCSSPLTHPLTEIEGVRVGGIEGGAEGGIEGGIYQTFSATGELWPLTVGCRPCQLEKGPRSYAFCFHMSRLAYRLSTGYPQVIRTLSAHYPHIIHTLSTCCRSYEKRVIERILRCRHGPTAPRCTARVRLLDWDSHADGCHT